MATRTIENPKYSFTFLNDEVASEDLIFNNDGNISSTSRMHGGMVSNNLVDDSEFHMPDTKRYIFSATGMNSGYQHKYYVQDRRNFVSEIRSRKNVINNSFIQELSKITATIDRNKMRDIYLSSHNNVRPNDGQLEHMIARGIYVVDYFNVCTKTKMSPSNNTISPGHVDTPITNYYKNSTAIQINNHDAISRVINNLIKSSHFNNRSSNWVTIRTITFIPEFILNEQKVVYLEEQDIVIAQDYLDPNMVHPFSRAGKMNQVEVAPPSSFIVNVNDTESTRGGYWIKVGNNVHKIIASCDPSAKQGGSISTTNQNGEVISYREASLDELGNQLGIYPTQELALHDGVAPDEEKRRAKEREIELEERKHNMAMNKLDKEENLINAKHNYDMFTAKEKYKQAKFETERKCAEHLLAGKKIELEMEFFKVKHNNDWFEYETEIIQEALVSGERILTKSLDIVGKLAKYFI